MSSATHEIWEAIWLVLGLTLLKKASKELSHSYWNNYNILFKGNVSNSSLVQERQ